MPRCRTIRLKPRNIVLNICVVENTNQRKQCHQVPLDKPVGDDATLAETINDERASMCMTIAEIEPFVDDVSLEIFKLLARGYTQDQAAAAMAVTQGTISRRIKRIREACLD